MTRRRVPVATLVTLAVTGGVTALQFPFPVLIDALRRDPHALAAGEWWRIATPLLIHPEGWLQIVVDFAALAVLGVMAERVYGSRRWLVLYLVPGIIGHLAGYAWNPYSAGSSVGSAGLGGALAAWLLLSRDVPTQARFGGVLGLLAGLGLTAARNMHGPPILAGLLLATLMCWRDWRASASPAERCSATDRGTP